MVKAFSASGDAETVAKDYGVSVKTVYRLSEQMKKTGSVDLRTSQRGRKKKLSAEDLNQIKSLLAKQPTLTIHEITEQLHLKASEETVRRIVVRMGFTRKKLMIHASEQERPRCAEEEKRVEIVRVKSAHRAR